MSVIAHLRIPADAFELGRILEMASVGTIELENMVPLGEKPSRFSPSRWPTVPGSSSGSAITPPSLASAR